MKMNEQATGARRADENRVDEPGSVVAQVRAVAARLRGVARSLTVEDPRAARAVARAGQRIERLGATLRTPRPRSWLYAASRVVRQLPSVALETLRGVAARRVKPMRPSVNEAIFVPVLKRPLDESRLPRHDGPSGYFSARAEGATKNTIPAATPPRS
jgi:hypothetical protein